MAKADDIYNFIRGKAEELAKQKIGADISIGGIGGNPITGITASDIEVSRSGEKLLSVKGIRARISYASLLSGSPRLSSVALNGLETSLDGVRKLIPETQKEKEADVPTDIPVDRVILRDSSLETQWGVAAVSRARIRIQNSFSFGGEINGSINGRQVSASGSIEKRGGNWNADGLKLKLDKGLLSLSGAVYPSPDVKVSLDSFSIGSAAELVPALKKYGVSGILSGSATASGSGKEFVSHGSGSLSNAVIRGVPLKQLETEWNIGGGAVKIEVSQGKVFDSSVSGSLEMNNTPGKEYLRFSADVKNLKFTDWTSSFEQKAAGSAAMFVKGGISSFTADVEGPPDALKGRIELGSSDVSYKNIAFRDIKGSAVFEGRSTGDLDLTAKADGKEVLLKGRLSFSDKADSDLTLTVKGYPLGKILSSFPQTEKLKADGTVSLTAHCGGPAGKWVVKVDASSPSMTADKIGTLSGLNVSASFGTDGGILTLDKASAQWNGASLAASGTYSVSDGKADFSGNFKNLDTKRLYQFAPAIKGLGVEGVASGSFGISGATQALTVKCTAQAGACAVRGARISKLSADAEYAGDTVKFNRIEVFAGGGSGVLSGDVALPGKSAQPSAASWKICGTLDKIGLSALNGMLKDSGPVSGDISGTISAASSPNGPVWSADLSGSKLQWREFKADSLSVRAEGGGREILLNDINGIFLKGSTSGKGKIILPKDGEPITAANIELDLHTEKLNVYELLRRHLPSVRSVQGLIEAEASVTGTLGDPRFSGTARLAPFRYRGFLLPIVDVKYEGSLKGVSFDGAAVLKDGNFTAKGKFYNQDGEWMGDFDIDGKDMHLRQFGAYLPQDFRARLGGTANFNMTASGKLSEISGKGSITSPRLRIMGIRFEDLNAPFYISKNFMIVENLQAKTNGGTLAGGVGFDLQKSAWGGNLTVLSTDVSMLVKQAAPKLKGSITGTGDLKIRGGGETGRLSTIKAGGALYLHNGEVTSFDVLETAKKFTGGKPLRFETVQATFTYDGGMFNLLPGSQAIAPANDPLYRYVMLDGTVNEKKELSFFAMGKVNIRALNSLIGAFQGILSSGTDLVSGQLNTNELLQNVLGGVLSGFAKNEFRFVTMNIGGTIDKPNFYNAKVARNVQQRSAKALIPNSGSDPDEDSLNDGNTTFRFKFEIPMGPGGDKTKSNTAGDIVGQTLENLLRNIDFGL